MYLFIQIVKVDDLSIEHENENEEIYERGIRARCLC